MRKSLQSMFCIALLCFTANGIKAQSEGTKILLPKTIAQQQAAKKAQYSVNVASCGPDTIIYPYLKELAFTAPNDSFFVDAMVGSVRTASQGYELTGNANIIGIQFWGGAYTVGSLPKAVPVKLYLYSVDATFQPLAKLDSATVTVTETYDFYEANFSVPHALSGDSFAVAVKSDISDTVAVVTNNAGNVWSTNYGEGLAWRKFGSGTWNMSVNFFGQDLEYMIWPIVSYDITSSFTASADTLCVNDSVMFTNTSSAIAKDRMFNLYAFDAFWGFSGADSTYSWNFGDNMNWTTGWNGAHAYTAPGTYTVSLSTKSLGYYTSCADTMMMAVYVPSVDVTTTFMNDTIWSNATGATYQWMECNADTLVGGATLNYYAPMVDGDYAVIVTKDGCTDTSACVNFSTVNIKNIAAPRVIVYPNPAHDNITINSGYEIAQQIIVTNGLGEVVSVVKPVSTNSAIDLSGLSNSVYFIKVMFNNSYKVVKVTKQ